jgi:hypothetical protein
VLRLINYEFKGLLFLDFFLAMLRLGRNKKKQNKKIEQKFEKKKIFYLKIFEIFLIYFLCLIKI